MESKDFTTTILVDQTPQQAFEAINNVRGWWSENIEGSTDTLNSTYDYHYKDIHICKIKVIELTPGKRVAWQVLENTFNFIQDQNEWVGTKIIFDITPKDGKTEVRFTHEGLNPSYECYSICFDAWTGFIQQSLRNLIATGKGEPTPKDGAGEINKELAVKYDLE
jgi:hypothetical protein